MQKNWGGVPRLNGGSEAVSAKHGDSSSLGPTQNGSNQFRYTKTKKFVCSFFCSHRSLLRLLRTARFTRALHCAHSFTPWRTHSLPSWDMISKWIQKLTLASSPRLSICLLTQTSKMIEWTKKKSSRNIYTLRHLMVILKTTIISKRRLTFLGIWLWFWRQPRFLKEDSLFDIYLFLILKTTIFPQKTYFLRHLMVILKTDLIPGSSMQGNALLASVGWNWVVAKYCRLPSFLK